MCRAAAQRCQDLGRKTAARDPGDRQQLFQVGAVLFIFPVRDIGLGMATVGPEFERKTGAQRRARQAGGGARFFHPVSNHCL